VSADIDLEETRSGMWKFLQTVNKKPSFLLARRAAASGVRVKVPAASLSRSKTLIPVRTTIDSDRPMAQKEPADESEEDDSGSEVSSEGETEEESKESEEEEPLASFAVHSRKLQSKPSLPKSSKPPKTKGAKKVPAKRAPDESKLIVPYVGPITGVEDVELCSDQNASIERHLEDTEKLLAAFEASVNGHQSLITRAVALTQERCNKEYAEAQRVALQAATLAAVQATEMNMRDEMRASVAQAVEDARAEAKAAQEVAVADAVRAAEERAREMQRLAVQNVSLAHQRSIGVTEEDLVAAKAASDFQQAAASAAAALSFSSHLLSRDSSQPAGADADSEVTADSETLTAAEQTKLELLSSSKAELQFF
jgi:hypothetical protein